MKTLSAKLANVIENAAKVSPPGAPIAIDAMDDGSGALRIEFGQLLFNRLSCHGPVFPRGWPSCAGSPHPG